MPERLRDEAESPRLSVDLWRVDLDAAVPGGDRVLSAEERRRAERFVFERDRLRYVAGRTALRRILGRRIACPPESLAFADGPFGKPHLSRPSGPFFNLSHSGAFCTVALCATHEVGVDIERIEVYEPGVAREAFAPEECAAIEALAPVDRGRAFALFWTRKEAFLKAIGSGFSYPSREVVVTLGGDDGGRVTACRSEAGAPESWRLLGFEPFPGIVGAIALQAEAQLRLRED